MQTFVPLPDYLASMRVLDKVRLGNQVWREGLTLIRGGWPNHPANKMWKGHEYHLGLYLLAGLQALSERGREYPEVRKKIETEMAKHPDTGPPKWWGTDKVHASHRSNLLRKDPVYYSQYGWSELSDLPYYWPTKELL
jgi:hypothetical protein